MRVLCTYPGRYGDLLWALPAVRAIATTLKVPIDLGVAPKYRAITQLIEQQPYVAACYGIDGWAVEETAPMSPREPPRIPEGYDLVLHLGYEGWPAPTLAQDVYERARALLDVRLGVTLGHLDLSPWITPIGAIPAPRGPRVWLGWSEEHFELKVGITQILCARFPAVQFWWIRPFGGRYDEYAVRAENLHLLPGDWLQTARWAASCTLYLGCLSSQWCLANALGLRCVAIEPAEARWHPVFWSDGGGRNTLVRGNDGRPTFDARHIGDALDAALREG